MKRQVIILLAIAVSVVSAHSNSSVRSQVEGPRRAYAGDQILIKLRPNAIIDRDEFHVAEGVLPSRNTRAERLLPRNEDDTYVIHLRENLSAEEAIAEVRRDPRVEYAEPNYLY